MCGIAGIMFKSETTGLETGRALVEMLDGCQHRGPDSTGFALYAPADEGTLRIRFFVGDGDEAAAAIERINDVLSDHHAEVVSAETIGINYRVIVKFGGDLQRFAYAVEHAARVVSIGTSLDIVKDVGSAHDVNERYDVSSFQGSHGLGHVRLATESDVKPEASHPFWATGFADVAIVHNGQITNYWKMRRRLQQRGFEFTTDNDSELIAVYLADKLSQGISLKESLRTSIDDLDGTFSFLVSTRNEIGYAKDRIAAKPMIMYENDDLIAVASEEVSLNRLFPGQALDTSEPPPGTYDTWTQ
ncbi:MAG TPA: amidophosphoribosyltransferase [Candidatus Latescibacteria bacterium]|nr:amidophosphoribosyltransferase [Candidatus Latescibacterota bacterium]HIM56128.1 amidophosphoribosyltransferase [Candidatus Latescibacterota bacterium]